MSTPYFEHLTEAAQKSNPGQPYAKVSVSRRALIKALEEIAELREWRWKSLKDSERERQTKAR